MAAGALAASRMEATGENTLSRGNANSCNIASTTPAHSPQPSMIELKLQILKNNRIQDVITVKSSTKFEKAKSVSARMQMDGKNLGEYVGKYLSKRLGK